MTKEQILERLRLARKLTRNDLLSDGMPDMLYAIVDGQIAILEALKEAEQRHVDKQ